MKITLTKDEMLQRLRVLAGLDSLRADCTIEYTDGIDVDAMLEIKLRAWYLGLLDSAPASLLAPADITSVAAVEDDAPAEGCRVTVPGMCRRAFDIRLGGWLRAVPVLPAANADQVLRRQLNPYTRATAASPVAVAAPGGADGAMGGILAWPAAADVCLLTAVVDPGPDKYVMDEAAMGALAQLAASLGF